MLKVARVLILGSALLVGCEKENTEPTNGSGSIGTPYMELTTAKEMDETISLYLVLNREESKSIWIDLNNNHQKDAGEDDISFHEGEDEDEGYYIADQKFRISAKTIRIYGKVKRLGCSSNQLTSLDISKNLNLKYLNCGSNQLTNLDVSKNVNLKTLSCSFNQLTSLDVSKNVKLEELVCYENQLTSLDVSKNLNLKWLSCEKNQLSSLDVSKNVKLELLICDLDCVKASQEQINAAQNGNISVNWGDNPEILQLDCK